MITSRNGWVETPNTEAPAGIEAFAATLVPHRLSGGRPIHLVAGLRLTDAHGAPDVMRGEEAEILGYVATGVSADFILP